MCPDPQAGVTSPGVATPVDGKRADTGSAVRAHGRGTTDYFIRNLHEQLVQLSSQADLKASIVLTVCTVVLSISFARAEPRTSTWVLGAGLLAALIAAILAVLPSIRSKTPADRDVDLLFFAQFSQLPRDRYVEAMATVMRSDADVYDAQIRNIHNQAVYLMHHTYRYLRVSYAGLLIAAFAAALTELGTRVL